MKLEKKKGLYLFKCCGKLEGIIPNQAGFIYHPLQHIWYTKSFEVAYKLIGYVRNMALKKEMEELNKKRENILELIK
jgi:hypothetical protein